MKKYRDHYFNKAKQENYPARSVYKLQELDRKFKLFAPGQRILDLGAAPGSWTLYAAKKVGEEGLVLSVDLQETETGFPRHVTYIQADILEIDGPYAAAVQELGPFDHVVSDMAPRTTGHKFTDQARSAELAERALELAVQSLKLGGGFVVKIFQGPDDQLVREAMRKHFESVRIFKPKSSRSESKEIFYVGLAYKGQPSTSQAGEPVETE